MRDTYPENIYEPKWLWGDKINELLFCKEFLEIHPMICINGTFFTADGRVTDENKLKKEILKWIEPYVATGIPKKITNLLDTMRVLAYSEPLPTYTDRIFLTNGTYYLSGEFEDYRDFCTNRLPVAYNPDAPAPVQWLEFLDQLLYPEDIPTLQEYMGYCLIPSTKGQQMLFLVGKGGEGKSRVGLVMRSLLGDNMGNGSIQKVETSPFARADLEHLLVLVDDDLKLEALSQTNYIKAIITADTPMDLERKGKQSYQGILHARFLAFGNASLQALHDRSHGFFRRQIILRVKPRDPHRQDDPYLGTRLAGERDSIFLWALAGLYRLIGSNYRFTISSRTAENLAQAIEQSNNMESFLKSQGYFRLDPCGCVSSRALYQCYQEWCADNATQPFSPTTFRSCLTEKAGSLGLTYSHNIDIGCNRRVRGYRGIRLCRGV